MIESLAFYVSVFHKDFTAYCNQRLADAGLSQGQLYFILYVGRNPDCAPKELAGALHMDMGHTVRSLARLEQSGFLVQGQNPRDRRARVLRLTETGQAAFKLIHDFFPGWDNGVMAALSAEEREQLLSLLQKLIFTEEGLPCVRNHSQPH